MNSGDDLFEFAVSCGEGTLLDYGVSADLGDVLHDIGGIPRRTYIVAPCADDCATGQ